MELEVEVKQMFECLPCDFTDGALTYVGEHGVQKFSRKGGTYPSSPVWNRYISGSFR